jgi:hypothetical protein
MRAIAFAFALTMVAGTAFAQCSSWKMESVADASKSSTVTAEAPIQTPVPPKSGS